MSSAGRDAGIEELYQVLATIPSVKSDFMNMMIRLKRRQLTGSQQCAKETIELLRSLLARYTFSATDHMMRVVKAFGRELTSAAPTELVIGNVVRRALFYIRDEHHAQLSESQARQQELLDQEGGSSKQRPRTSSKDQSSGNAAYRRGTRSNSLTDSVNNAKEKRDRSGSTTSVNSVNSNTVATSGLDTITEKTERLSFQHHPSATYNSGSQHLSTTTNNAALLLRHSQSFDTMLGHLDSYPDDATDLASSSSAGANTSSALAYPHSANNAQAGFSRHFPQLKSAVISAVHELSAIESDNHSAIASRAPDYVHADECILVYGYSKLVEVFLRAAAAKRRFQLIVAEAAPGLEGHIMAQTLSKLPQVAVTLIPDSNIYAIMARVNKVVLAPQAVMADGSAMASSGQLMCAVAAQEFRVPVVCLATAFALTPLFAHNNLLALQQLLSPSHVLPYHLNDDSDHHVEVLSPAFDLVAPELVSLYVTNDGVQLPSYVFRQLSEYYHVHDYVL